MITLIIIYKLLIRCLKQQLIYLDVQYNCYSSTCRIILNSNNDIDGRAIQYISRTFDR